MPTNGQSEYLLFGLDGTPLFTYGMIGLTTIVIAYATMLDKDDNVPNFLKSDANPGMQGGYSSAAVNTTNAVALSEIPKKTKKRKTIRKR